MGGTRPIRALHRALLAAGVAALLAPAAAGAAERESLRARPSQALARTEERDRVATSFDGTKIVYNLFLPDGASPTSPVPAVLITHGWGGTRANSPPGLVDRGYAVLSWDQRGFGQSGGQAEVDSPGFEDRDVSALVDVLAGDARIAQESAGDPLVGMSGGSYAGGVQFIAAAHDPRIDAIAPEIAWNNLLESLIPEGVVKTLWGALLYLGGQTSVLGGLSPGPAGTQLGSLDPMLHRALLEGTALGTFSEPVRRWLAHRGPDRILERVEVPTLILQGTTDTLFPLSQAIDNFETLSSLHPDVPLKMLWYCGGHGVCDPFEEGPDGYIDARRAQWFDRYLKGEQIDTGPRFEYLTQDGEWHGAADYPVPGTVPRLGRGGGGTLVNGEPTLGGVVGLPATRALSSLKVPVPGDSGTVIGRPLVRLTATALGSGIDEPLRVPLFFQLVNLRNGEVVGNQITPKVIAADGRPHAYEFPIEAVSYRLRAGDRLALEVVPTSLNYEPYRGLAVVGLERVEVELPVLP